MILFVNGFNTQIDEKDFHTVKHYSFCLQNDYVLCSHPTLPNGRQHLHVILMKTHGTALTVDHINRNKMDNRRCNLRVCTLNENLRNREKIKINKTSQYIGVSKNKRNWEPQVKVNGKTFHGKVCFFEIEAALAYDELARKYHGRFANLNFPTKQLYFNACVELDLTKRTFFANIGKIKYKS